MKLATLHDLMLDQLKDIYFAEKQLLKALPRMAKAAENPDLRQAFELHTKETQQHVNRVEKAFKMLDTTPRAKKCPAMLGLIEEASELLEEGAEPAVLDAGLIAAAQRVEHYEIAAYGTLASYAELLSRRDVQELFESILVQEKKADVTLTQIAEGQVNPAAAARPGDDEEPRVGPTVHVRSRSGGRRRAVAS